MKISLIASIGKNGELGFKNQLLWHLPDDLKNFKRVTSNHTVVMGQKTFESIGRPLPNRKNVILTRNKDYKIDGCTVIHSADDVIKLAKKEKETFIIGGGKIYKLFFPKAERLYLTEVNASLKADTFFPKFNKNDWILKSSLPHPKDSNHKYSFSLNLYEKAKNMVDKRYAKGKMYKKVINEISSKKVCPFCPETFKWHTKPILKHQNSWFITENFNPYKSAEFHFLIIGEEHKEDLSELSSVDWKSITSLCTWAIKKYKIKGGGIIIRFGDTLYTGATVKHLHLHLISPKVKNGKASPVYFPIG
jgi:dihydrofolate reductase